LNAPNVFGFAAGPLAELASMPVFVRPHDEDATVTVAAVAERAAAPGTFAEQATAITDRVFSAAHVDSEAPPQSTGQTVEFGRSDRAPAASNSSLADVSALAAFLSVPSLAGVRAGANRSAPGNFAGPGRGQVAPLVSPFWIQIDSPPNEATVPSAGFSVAGRYGGNNGPVLIDCVLTYSPGGNQIATGMLPPEDPANNAFNRPFNGAVPTQPGQSGLLKAILYDAATKNFLAGSETIEVFIS
jgi:hypothetical protein